MAKSKKVKDYKDKVYPLVLFNVFCSTLLTLTVITEQHPLVLLLLLTLLVIFGIVLVVVHFKNKKPKKRKRRKNVRR